MAVSTINTFDTISFLLIGIALLMLPVVITIAAREGGGKLRTFVILQIVAYLAIFGYIGISGYFYGNLVLVMYCVAWVLVALWVVAVMVMTVEEGALR